MSLKLKVLSILLFLYAIRYKKRAMKLNLYITLSYTRKDTRPTSSRRLALTSEAEIMLIATYNVGCLKRSSTNVLLFYSQMNRLCHYFERYWTFASMFLQRLHIVSIFTNKIAIYYYDVVSSFSFLVNLCWKWISAVFWEMQIVLFHHYLDHLLIITAGKMWCWY
jgi:hypothetical protein